MASGVRVEGLNKAVRGLQEFGVEITDLKSTFGGIASEGARLAARYAPVQSGALAKTVRGNKAKNKAVVTAGRARVRYAGVINYGWPKRSIRPARFMQRADEDMQPRALVMLEEGIEEAIKKTGLK